MGFDEQFPLLRRKLLLHLIALALQPSDLGLHLLDLVVCGLNSRIVVP